MRITKAEIERRLDARIEEYEEKAGKRYDHEDGWDQTPDQNRVAAIIYGQIVELESLLEG